MRLREIYQSGRFGLSVEIFPPKSEQGDAALYEALSRLVRFGPAFVSCTYGAGGSTRTRTIDICRTVQERFDVAATAHFTCVGATRDELADWLHSAVAAGIGNIMALRGDPPQGATDFQPIAGGLRYANELVSLIRGSFPDMGIGVAGYPEKHPEAPDRDVDLDNLRRKVDAGADAVFTQLFYDNASFYDFRDRAIRSGIRVPIIPGIMPITDLARIQRITSLCDATIPSSLVQRLEAARDDKAAQFEIGVDFAIEQCRDLLDADVPGLHFYVLNRSESTARILDALGIGSLQST